MWMMSCKYMKYLCVFVEMLGCPVFDVGLWGGLSQGEFWENATAGTWHHIPGISTGLKLGTGPEILWLTGEETGKGEEQNMSFIAVLLLQNIWSGLRAESVTGSWARINSCVNIHKVISVQQRVNLFLSALAGIQSKVTAPTNKELTQEKLFTDDHEYDSYKNPLWCPAHSSFKTITEWMKESNMEEVTLTYNVNSGDVISMEAKSCRSRDYLFFILLSRDHKIIISLLQENSLFLWLRDNIMHYHGITKLVFPQWQDNFSGYHMIKSLHLKTTGYDGQIESECLVHDHTDLAL